MEGINLYVQIVVLIYVLCIGLLFVYDKYLKTHPDEE